MVAKGNYSGYTLCERFELERIVQINVIIYLCWHANSYFHIAGY